MGAKYSATCSALVLALLCVALRHTAAADVASAVVSGTAAIAVEDYFDRPPVHTYWVHLDNGKRQQVKFPNGKPTGFRTGARVKVTGTSVVTAAPTAAASERSTSLRTSSLIAPSSASSTVAAVPVLAAQATTVSQMAAATAPPPTTISTLVLILQFSGSGCNIAPATTPTGVASILYQEAGGTYTTGGVFNAASYGQTTMPQNQSLILTANLGCSGTANGNAWVAPTSSTCDWSNYGAAADQWAGNYASANSINLASYTHHIYIMPKTNGCGWSGLAYIGCCCGTYNGCQMWANGQTLAPSLFNHELGHNMNFHHAHNDVANTEYGDWSCSMGYCCSTRGYNTPHVIQAGWATPTYLASAQLAPAGKTVTVNIAPQLNGPNTGVKITPDWMSTTVPYLVFGHRRATGIDSGIGNMGGMNWVGVSVHKFTSQSSTDAQPTLWEATLTAAGNSYKDTVTNLTARVIAINSTNAQVSFCQSSATVETNCFDGLDNDCNGLVDAADPACKGVTVAPTAIPTPAPTAIPTPAPTTTPKPTAQPTAAPVATLKPTQAPTPAPTAVPTPAPTTQQPTPALTLTPTATPTQVPTQQPTPKPTPQATAKPTPQATPLPTPAPTDQRNNLVVQPAPPPAGNQNQQKLAPSPPPTPKPTLKPTQAPTKQPTKAPTLRPTPKPTPKPTLPWWAKLSGKRVVTAKTQKKAVTKKAATKRPKKTARKTTKKTTKRG